MTTPESQHLGLVRKVVGGYDQSDVNVLVGRIDRELTEKSAQLLEVKEEVRRLQAQIDLAKRERPSFSELGGAFEDALKMAEDQSAKLVSDALAEATQTIAEATKRSRSLVETAEIAFNSRINEETNSAQRKRLVAEQESARTKAELAEQSNLLSIELSRAEREVAQLIADVEREIKEKTSSTTREIERLRRESIDAAREAKEMRTTTEFELRQREDEARAEIRSLTSEAESYAKHLFAEADDHTQTSLEAASKISREADEYVLMIQERADRLETEAEQRGLEIIEQASQSAEQILAESESFVNEFVDGLENRIKLAREQMEDLSLLAQNLKLIVNGFDLGEVGISRKTSVSGDVVTAEIVED